MEKRKTNNPNGRPKGVPNRSTAEMRQWVQKLIDSNSEQLEADLMALEPHQRWVVVEKLMQYVLPKKKEIDANINFSELSDDQLDAVINQLTNNINDGE